MAPRLRDWRKMALASGLLLVLAYGLLQIPEVRGWHNPEFLWEIKVRQLQQECPRIENKLKSAEAILENLNDFRGKGAGGRSWNARLRKVQEDCISLQSKTRYFNAKLVALKVAMEGKIPGASPASASKLNSLLDQVKEMELQGLQYRFTLEYTFERLRTVKLARVDQKSGQVR